MSEELSLKTIDPESKETEPKSQAQLDYESGQKFLQEDDITQAANAFHNALISFQKDKDENGIANASDKLGDICLKKNNYDQALSNWEIAYKICEKNKDKTSLVSIVKKRANLYRQWNKLDQAIESYLDILDAYHDDNNPQGTVNTLELLSEIYLENGAKNLAIDCLRTAASIHKNFKHNSFADKLLEKATKLEQDN